MKKGHISYGVRKWEICICMWSVTYYMEHQWDKHIFQQLSSCAAYNTVCYMVVWYRFLFICILWNIRRLFYTKDSSGLVKHAWIATALLYPKHKTCLTRGQQRIVFIGVICHCIYITSYYSDAIVSATASQITGVSIVCTTVCSGVSQRIHQSAASLAFVRGIHRWPVDSPPKGQ